VAKRIVFRLGHAFINLLWLAAGMYGGVVTTLLVVKLVAGGDWLPVELFSSFLPLSLLPALILWPVSLWRRRWRLSALLVTAVIAFVVWYGGNFVPSGVPRSSTAATLRLMTYNLHAETNAIAPLAAVIRESQADLVALQEVSPELAQVLSRELSDAYPYQALHPASDNAILGQGVLSRYPIRTDEYWRIALGHQRVEVDLGDESLTLYNTHPVHPFRLREGKLFDSSGHQQEVDVILSRAKRDTGPVIIAGDFNMSDQSSDYQRIAQDFNDAYRERGWGLGFTFPDFAYASALPANLPVMSLFVRPLARLDYVFHSADLQALSAYVVANSGGSDHRPVLAEFSVKSPQISATH
jgi:vancomycin resistance protein VanJ